MSESDEKMFDWHDLMEYVIKHDPNAIAIHDKDMNYMYVSERYLKDYRVTRQDVIGKHHYEIFPDIPEKWRDVHQRALSGETVSGDGSQFIREDGSVDYTRWQCRPWYLSDGTVGGIVLYTEVITERKRVEQAIAEKNRELEQVVYVASHDLRSPLVNVDGYGRELEYAIEELEIALAANDTSEISLKSVAKSLMPDMKDALGHIRNSTKQMDKLLKGLLKLSRTGRASLKIEQLNMNQLLDQVLNSMEYHIKEIGVEIQLEELPSCMGDAVQLNQVFSNLIGNALKYLDQTRSGKIRITGSVVSDTNSIYCLEDNGIGIAEGHQQKIFELFHRLAPADTDGEGLGLTVVRQILGRIDGNIRVESKLGEGSRFYVTLPYAKSKGENHES